MTGKTMEKQHTAFSDNGFRIQGKFTAAVFALLFILVGLSWYFLFFHAAEDTSNAAVRDTSEIYLHEIVSQKENQIQMNLQNHIQRLASTAETMDFMQISDEDSMRSYLERMKNANDFTFLGMLDQEGMVHTEKRSFPGISRFNFIAKDLNEQIIEFNNTVSSSNLVMFIVPMNGMKYGETELTALIGGVDTKTVSNRMALFDYNTNTFCEIVLRNGAYVIQAPYDHLGSGSNFLSAMEYRAVYDEGYSQKQLEDSMTSGKSEFISYTVDGVRYFTYLVPVNGTDWYLKATIQYDAVSQGVEVVRSTLTRNSMIQMFLLLIVCSGAFGVYLFMRKHQDEVTLARIQAEENNRAKTAFLFQMSHDIRTPMNAIVGFTDFAIRETDISVIKEEYLPKIKTSSEHLLLLINDVLEMSRIESGKMELHEEPEDLSEILQEGFSIISVRAREEGLKLIMENHLTNGYVYCDKLRIHQILMNLLGNAVKFTPENGTVTLSMSQNGCERVGWQRYELKVSDTGIGMKPEFLEHVFEPFERERSSTVSRKEGSGLGLSIVKSIVDAMGGKITVESVQGEGSSFTVFLELRLAEPEQIAALQEKKQTAGKPNLTPEEQKALFAGKHVLLVEDNEFNRYIADAMLREYGFLVDHAENGSVAVEMTAAQPAGYYHVILMDVQMPVMNGYEATKAIRALGEGRSEVRIVAVTANAFDSDVADALAAGMDGHIAKPIDMNALQAVFMETGH